MINQFLIKLAKEIANKILKMLGSSFFYEELFTALNSNCLHDILSMGSVRRTQDPNTQGYILALKEGKIKVPRADKGFEQPFTYLALQGLFAKPNEYSLQVYVTCRDSTKKKLYFSDVNEFKVKETYAIVPNFTVCREKWVNLCIDLGSFVEQIFNTQISTIDFLLLSGNAKLRLAFALKFPLNDSNLPMSTQNRSYLLPSFYDIPNTKTQLLTYFKVKITLRMNHASTSSLLPSVQHKEKSLNSTFSSSIIKYKKHKANKNSESYQKLIKDLVRLRYGPIS